MATYMSPIWVACYFLSDQNAYSVFLIMIYNPWKSKIIYYWPFLYLKKLKLGEFKSVQVTFSLADISHMVYFYYINDIEKYYLYLLISFICIHNDMHCLHIAHSFLYRKFHSINKNSKWIKHESSM